jgi:hypothetical protein
LTAPALAIEAIGGMLAATPLAVLLEFTVLPPRCLAFVVVAGTCLGPVETVKRPLVRR